MLLTCRGIRRSSAARHISWPRRVIWARGSGLLDDPLSDAERDTALQAGEREARRLLAGNPDIAGAVLSLGDKIRLVGLTQDSPASALELAVPMLAGKTVTKPVEELSYA